MLGWNVVPDILMVKWFKSIFFSLKGCPCINLCLIGQFIPQAISYPTSIPPAQKVFDIKFA